MDLLVWAIMERTQGSMEDGLPGQSSMVTGASYLFCLISLLMKFHQLLNRTMRVVTALGLQGGYKRGGK